MYKIIYKGFDALIFNHYKRQLSSKLQCLLFIVTADKIIDKLTNDNTKY